MWNSTLPASNSRVLSAVASSANVSSERRSKMDMSLSLAYSSIGRSSPGTRPVPIVFLHNESALTADGNRLLS